MTTSRGRFGGAGAAQPAMPGSHGLAPSRARRPDATRLGPVRLLVADLDRSLGAASAAGT
jgi:hypothetical protein